ncbi:hypothetical protein T03_1018 [Trichinella britovi]|uniref:Uncharacterized protein n=1 Tax=Trichinella britovi TaxID=45882 RepID=A0A0V1CJW9_TRIBR|nr:hypothetical protein T03_1018 [Trichinella britovi]
MIVGERGAANEQWRFQCDDRRRRPLKTALYRRIEDKRRHHKDKDWMLTSGNASNFRVLMLTLRVSSQFHLILRLISRICLCQTLFAFLVTSHMLVKHDYKGKLSIEINFKCIMPKLMKGATPNELVKGVTANLMPVIGQVSEPPCNNTNA